MKTRYLMIGGFLGAGKTTCVARLAQWLSSRGQRVGLITNDQGSHLVDTALLRSRGFATEEIPGGCFCCRFNSLVQAARNLTAANQPDVFIAEPVGSCTDLVATVSYPLRRLYGDNYGIAPLSVVVDPVRAARMLGLEEGGSFSEKVRYIYRKQLEEADLIVLNKADLVDEERQERIQRALAGEFPGKELRWVSARTGAGLDDWFVRITEADQAGGVSMEVDYEVYAEGEALLGWLNATVQVKSASGCDGDTLLHRLAQRIQSELTRSGAEIAHLKITLSHAEGLGDLGAVNLVRNDFVPELSLSLSAPVEAGELILNLRAEGAPETLKSAVENAIQETAAAIPGLTLRVEHLEHFRPGKPQPTHRDRALATAGS